MENTIVINSNVGFSQDHMVQTSRGLLKASELVIGDKITRVGEESHTVQNIFCTNQTKKLAVEEAGKMMMLPIKDLPALAHEFLQFLSKKVGFCGETCMTAFAAYNQVVLKMECEDNCYKLTEPDLLKWWEEKGYVRGFYQTLSD